MDNPHKDKANKLGTDIERLDSKLESLYEQLKASKSAAERAALAVAISKTQEFMRRKTFGRNKEKSKAEVLETIRKIAAKYAKEEIPVEKILESIAAEDRREAAEKSRKAYLDKKRQEVMNKRRRK